MEAATWTAIGVLAASSLGMLFYLYQRIDALATRVDSRVDPLAGRIGSLEARMEARFDNLESRLDTHLERHTGTG